MWLRLNLNPKIYHSKHGRSKLMIRGFDQILMIYGCVLSETLLHKVQVFVVAFSDKVKAGHNCFERPGQ